MKNPPWKTMREKIKNNKQTNNFKKYGNHFINILVKKFLSLYLYIEKDNKEK